jgi:hypothetical protein
MMSVHREPPRLPEPRWSSSYISYWAPTRPGDRLTSGHVWYDYERRVYRIDGVVNPWDRPGETLWRSEIHFFGDGACFQRDVSYTQDDHGQVRSTGLLRRRLPPGASIVPADLLITCHAQFDGQEEVLGMPAERWRFTRPDGRPSIWYLRPETSALVRMVTGDPREHALIRDLPTFSTSSFPESVFAVEDSADER